MVKHKASQFRWKSKANYFVFLKDNLVPNNLEKLKGKGGEFIRQTHMTSVLDRWGNAGRRGTGGRMCTLHKLGDVTGTKVSRGDEGETVMNLC